MLNLSIHCTHAAAAKRLFENPIKWLLQVDGNRIALGCYLGASYIYLQSQQSHSEIVQDATAAVFFNLKIFKTHCVSLMAGVVSSAFTALCVFISPLSAFGMMA